MASPEFDPEAHEKFVRSLHAEQPENYAQLQRYALFDELIDFALDGVVTIDEAVAQYKHDAEDL